MRVGEKKVKEKKLKENFSPAGFDPKDELDIGEHVFDFESDLPKHLPNSFEGQHGRVRYTVKGIIEMPKKLNSKAKVPFTVVSLLDLNKDPNAAVSIKLIFNCDID